MFVGSAMIRHDSQKGRGKLKTWGKKKRTHPVKGLMELTE